MLNPHIEDSLPNPNSDLSGGRAVPGLEGTGCRGNDLLGIMDGNI